MKLPKISIIVPCKNAGHTIQKTFDSLRSQNYKNFECIVIDGSSTDNTLNIVEKNMDVVKKVISEDDISGAEACNKGIDIATGDIIGFLYADDYLVDNALHEISQAAAENPNYNIYSFGLSIEKLDTKKIIMESYSIKNIKLKLSNILFKHVLNHFYRKEVFSNYGKLTTLYYDKTVFFSNDREFMIRLCLNGVKNFVIEKILYKMGTHVDSHTGNRKNIVKIRYEHIGIADYYLKNMELSEYKIRKLIDFKSHNLSLLFIYYAYKLDFNNLKIIFNRGYELKSYSWVIDIFKCPFSEILYRSSVKKWI